VNSSDPVKMPLWADMKIEVDRRNVNFTERDPTFPEIACHLERNATLPEGETEKSRIRRGICVQVEEHRS